MKLKKFLAMALCACMLTSALTGCGGGSNSSADGGNTNEGAGDSNASASDGAPVHKNAALTGADAYDQDQINPHTFIFGQVGAEGNSLDLLGKSLDAILREKTDGKMGVDVYNSGQLGTDSSMVSDIVSGSIDFYTANTSNLNNYVPELAALDMPFFYDNMEQFHEYLIDNDEFFEKVAALVEDDGFKLMPWQGVGWRQISTNVEIKDVNSFNGMRLRIPVIDSYIAVFESLGVATTAINSSELFLALQQNMVDGQENPYDQIYTYGFGEVQKYVTNSRHLQFLNQLVMSKKTWDSLNEEEQRVLWDAATEAADYNTEYCAEAQDYYLNLLQSEHGVTYIDFDEIDGMRDSLREKSFDYCYGKIKDFIVANNGDPSFLDEYITMRGFEVPA